MCFGPELLVSMALAGAGTVLQQSAAEQQAQRAAKARNNVMNQFLDRNKTRAEDARALFDQRTAQQDVEQQDAAQADATTKRTDAAADLRDKADIGQTPSLGGSAPKVVQEAFAKSGRDTKDFAARQGDALARSRSFGDLLFGNTLSTQTAANSIRPINNAAQSDAQLLPGLQDLAEAKAASKGSPLGLIGGLLSAGGSAVSMGAGSGGFNLFGSSAPMTSPVPIPRPPKLL